MSSDINRKRSKKWTEDEIRKILDFLKKNEQIGKPTGEIYFSSLAAEHGIVMDWRQIRCKVRHLKNDYFAQKKWAKSDEAERAKLHLEIDNIRDLLLKKCPLYNEMEEAFDKQICPQTPSNPTKWTEEEHRKILDFLIRNQPIGDLHSRIYFRRLVEEYGIVKDLAQLRKKVRKMRINYFKLEKWSNSEEAEQEKSQLGISNIRGILLKKCPLYYEMEQAFGKNMPENSMTSALSTNSDTEDESSWSEEKECPLPTLANSTITTLSNNFDTAVESTSPLSDEFAPSIKMEFEAFESDSVSANENAIDQVDSNDAAAESAMAMQALTQTLKHLVEVKRQKRESDIEFKEKELQLQREMLQLQKEMFRFESDKHYENVQLKTKEIEINEKIVTEELKTRETIALSELEMKERIEMAKIRKICIPQEQQFR